MKLQEFMTLTILKKHVHFIARGLHEISMETMSSSGLELSNLTRESFQSIIDKFNCHASSILSLILQWKIIKVPLGSPLMNVPGSFIPLKKPSNKDLGNSS